MRSIKMSKDLWLLLFSYERLERCMPGYGYPYRDGGKLDDPAPKDSGLFLVDLKENTSELLISLSELAQMEDESYRQDICIL